jgi:hypothetical protein
VAGQHSRLVRQRHEDVHHRCTHLGEIAAADGVLEQRVAGEDDVVDEEGDHVVGVARRRDTAHVPPAPLPLTGLRDHLDAVARAELVLVHDMVVVRVCP